MKEILLHIGVSKTGTTSLQSFLARALGGPGESRFGYPTSARGRHARGAHHNLFYDPLVGGQRNDSFAVENGGWIQLLAEVDRSPYEVAIISSEAFQYCGPEQVAQISELLAGRRVTVVVYLRRHDRWLESAWNQRARFGRVGLDFRDFVDGEGRAMADWARLLRPWIGQFGDPHVDVRIYESAVRASGVVNDFARSYGVVGDQSEQDEAGAKNLRAGVKHLVAVAEVTRVCRMELGDDYTLSRRGAIRISQFFRSRADCHAYSVQSFEAASRLQASYAGSDGVLRELSTSFRAAGEFPIPRAEEYETVVDIGVLDRSIFDSDERRFVERMALETVRATRGAQVGRS